MMSLETLEHIVRQALFEVTEPCCFMFQGGEPTLVGLDFFRALIILERRYNVNSKDQSRNSNQWYEYQ